MERHARLPHAVPVNTTLQSSVTLLPTRAPRGQCNTWYSTRLLNRASPFRSSLMHTTMAPSILVVDDEADIRSMVCEILSSEGYVVWPAKNGAEALAILDRRWPSLVLLDMRMPVLDGWAFARALPERRILLPIVVMTAAVDGQRWADQIGAAGCLSKPFDLAELVANVERLVPHC
jgi:two-component system, chemotaxis family, chemotaxis protein CheY